MQRWKKRAWTTTLVSGSVLLIIAAVLMGAVRLVDLLAPRYRQDIANRVTEAIEQPVQVGRIGMSWRKLRPTFDLDDVVVLDPDNGLPVFKLREIHVPFSWTALFRGKFEPAEVVLSGMAVTLEWRADGSLGVQGIEMLGASTEEGEQDSGELDVADIVQQLRVLGRVIVTDSELAWREFGEPIGLTHVSQLNAELNLGARDYSLTVDAELPPQLGDSISLMLEVTGDVAVLDTLESEFYLQAEGLQIQGWLQPLLLPGLSLRGGPAEVEIQSRWLGLRPEKASLLMASPRQSSWLGDEKQRDLPGLSTDLSLRSEGDGWVASINSLQYETVDGLGPTIQGHLAYQPLAGGFGTELEGGLDRVRISDLLAWSSVLAVGEGMPVPGQASGELQQLKFAFADIPGEPSKLQVEAGLKDLHTLAAGPLPGISGLQGQLHYDGEVAALALTSRDGQLVLPQVFENPVALTELETELQIRQLEDGLALSTQTLKLRSETVTAAGQLEFEIPQDERSPVIDLQLDFAVSDIRPVKPLIPIAPILPESVGSWLSASILSGVVPKGEMVLRGALADFPYEGETAGKGEFRIEFDIEQANLKYAPDWPGVEQVKGHAVFAGESMHILAHSGQMLGVPVKNVKANIADFGVALLDITGHVEADLDKQLSFLANSPLREDYESLLDTLTVEGPGALDLKLELPLADLEETRVSGDIHLRGAQLSFDGLPYPVTDVNGVLRFTESGLSGKDVKGRFIDLPAVAELSPQAATGGTATKVDAVLDVSLPQDAKKLQQLLGEAAPLSHFNGSTQVHFSSLFDSDGSSNVLALRSDLAGMAINLGAPLQKAAEDLRELKVGILPDSERLEIDWHYVDVLHGRIALQSVADGWQADRGNIRLGKAVDKLPLPQQPGWEVTGELPVLDLDAFSIAPGSGGEWPVLHGLDIHIGLLQFGGQKIRDMAVRLDKAQQQLQFTGADSEGTLSWRQTEARLMLDGEFKRIALTLPKQVSDITAKDALAETKPALDPASLPGLSLNVQQLVLGDEVLGSLKLRAQPIAHGLRLGLLDLKGKRLEVRGGGEWLRNEGQSSGALVINLNSDNIRGLLKASGFAPNIKAKQADVFVDVHWKPHPGGLEMAALNGKMNFEVVDGSLLDVEPGAGRVLSLLSFYSLPRRLTLDFSDVTGKGTGFDKLDGHFNIVDGNAVTKDMEVESPSMEIKVRGRIGLAARDYDQTVTIKPEVTSSVALAGAVFGGPVLGIGLWLAQEILDEPFEQVAKLRYHLGGTWDDPVIEAREVQSKKKASKGGSKKAPAIRKTPDEVPNESPVEDGGEESASPSGPRK